MNAPTPPRSVETKTSTHEALEALVRVTRADLPDALGFATMARDTDDVRDMQRALQRLYAMALEAGCSYVAVAADDLLRRFEVRPLGQHASRARRAAVESLGLQRR